MPNPVRLPAPLDRLAYGFYRAIALRVRSNPWLHQRLFGYRPLGTFPGPYWDYTTLDLRDELTRNLRPTERLLDMGTGPFAVVGLFAALRLGHTRVTMSDCHVEAIESARRHVEALGCHLDVIESDLFDTLSGEFDCIAFNPPYVSTSSGLKLGIFRRDDERARWDAGDDGMAVLRPFLHQAPAHLAAGGRLLLGVSHLFIDPTDLVSEIMMAGYRVDRTTRSRLGWSHLYVLSRG